MASVWKRKSERRRAGSRWRLTWADWELVDGRWAKRLRNRTGYTDKAATAALGRTLEDAALARRDGLTDADAERRAMEGKRPLTEHIGDYRAHLESLGRATKHVGSTCGALTSIAAALEWKSLGDVDAVSLSRHLGEQTGPEARSARWFNANVKAWRSLTRWAIRHRRLASDPLASMRLRDENTDRRRRRRALSAEELGALIRQAETQPIVKLSRPYKTPKGQPSTTTRRVNAPDRAWGYRLAAATGFRVAELASLTPESFNLDAEPPTVTVAAGYSKRKREDVQPIPEALAERLRAFLDDRPRREPLRLLPDRPAAVLKIDADAARAAWIAKATDERERAERERSDFLRTVDGTLKLDAHTLRHSFISSVVKAGADVRSAMELARHQSPTMTLRVYSHVRLADAARFVEALPDPEREPDRREAAQATGTEGGPPAESDGQRAAPAQRGALGLTLVGATGCSDDENREAAPTDEASRRNSRQNRGLRGAVQEGAPSRKPSRANRGERIRTSDLLTPSQTDNAPESVESPISDGCAAQAQRGARSEPNSDPELAAVVGAWADLPPAVRAGIAAMVNAARGAER